MRTRVYIATTKGPTLVQRLAPEEGLSDAELSAVCLDGTPTRLPITAAYTYFVRDHVRGLFGGAAYRLDLDRRIDGGASWMLGAWIAHLLLAEGRLALRDEPAGAAVFATGEVAVAPDAERRAEVRGVERISEKVAQLAGRAAEEARAERRLLLIVPRDNAAEAEAALERLPESVRRSMALHVAAEVGDVQGLLALERREADSGHRASIGGAAASTLAARARRRGVWLAAALLLCLAAAAVAHAAWERTQRNWLALRNQGRYLELLRTLEAFPLPALARGFRDGLKGEAAARAPSVSVAALRPADGGPCAGLRFRGGGTVTAPVRGSGALWRLGGLRSLCGFEVRTAPPEGAGTGHAWITLRLEAGGHRALVPARRLVSGPLAQGRLALSQDLPLFLQDSWAWTVTAVWSPVPSGDVERLLGESRDPEAPKTLARLDELGLSVFHARIELAP